MQHPDYFRLIRSSVLASSLFLGAFQAGAQLPVTDNSAPPYLGVFKESLGSQEGIRKDNYIASWLNRSTIYATSFNGNNGATWTEISGNSSYVTAWRRWCDSHPDGKIILGVQMLSGSGNNPGSGISHAKGARGDYDTYFRALATKIRDAGLCDQVIIRLGWEFNGNWYPWRIQPGSAENDAAHFAANYCRISKTMRELAATSTTDPGKMPANLQFNWCGVRFWNSYSVAIAFPANTPAATTSTGVSYPAYAGNDYVHMVGVDIYDTATWSTILGSSTSNNNGIARWQKIANDNGKRMSFPEWGLSTTTGSGNFDNPSFIQNMFNYIHNSANNVEFHAYFDVDASGSGGSNHRIGQYPGEPATVNPLAAEKYRQLFSPPMPDRTNIGSITATTKADGLNVVGAGAGYTGSSDNFYFTSRPGEANDMFQVKLNSASVAAGQSGIMLRQDTSGGAVNAALFVSNGDIVFQTRSTSGGTAAANTVAPGVSYPIWLRLVRRGTSVTAYQSADGLNWTYSAGATLSNLSGAGMIGMAVSSGAAGTLNTVALDNLDNANIPRGSESSIPTAILKDNADPSGVSFTGTWSTGTTRTDRIGADYRNAGPSAGAITATFNPQVTGSGLHAIYVINPTDKTFAFDVPVTVNHTGGSDSFVANQASGVGFWTYVGTYNLDGSSNVVITNSTNGLASNTLVDAVLFVPLPSAALPSTRDAEADAFCRDGTYAANNYGIATYLENKLDGANFVRESYIRFDVSGLANAGSIKVVLTTTGAGSDAPTTSLTYEMCGNDSWTESGITWSNRPTTGMTFLASAAGYTVGQQVELDITAQAKAEAAGDGLFTLRIRSTSSGSQRTVTFGSRENATAGNRPFLEITP